jgi:MOSC domain-containing protein YiiM
MPAPSFLIRRLFISEGHRFFGRHGQSPSPHPIVEVPAIECVAGRGIRGDRFFDYRSDYRGQITFFSAAVFAELCQALGIAPPCPSVLRRNVLLEDLDIEGLVGGEFEIQGVRFAATEECRPCFWMDQAVAPGAEAWLRGRGGLRARILSDGWLRAAALPK